MQNFLTLPFLFLWTMGAPLLVAVISIFLDGTLTRSKSSLEFSNRDLVLR